MIKFIKKLYTRLFRSPKCVLYINVGNMPSEEIPLYIKTISDDLKLRRTLYIPTRTKETEFVYL
jgi:hypothetical protein